jgi:hypothetical protein
MKNSIIILLLLALICMSTVVEARRTFNNLSRYRDDAPARKPLTKPAKAESEESGEEEEEEEAAQPLLVVSSTQD